MAFKIISTHDKRSHYDISVTLKHISFSKDFVEKYAHIVTPQFELYHDEEGKLILLKPVKNKTENSRLVCRPNGSTQIISLPATMCNIQELVRKFHNVTYNHEHQGFILDYN